MWKKGEITPVLKKVKVKVGGQYSSWSDITRGIAQGSIFGPLVFNIFINDLFYIVKQCSLSSYADDTQIVYAHCECTEVERAVNSDLGLVDKWYDLSGLKRSNSNCQAIVILMEDITIFPSCIVVKLYYQQPSPSSWFISKYHHGGNSRAQKRYTK